MAFYLAPLPTNRDEWILFLTGGLVFLIFLFWSINIDRVEIFETGYEWVFWTSFVIFWSVLTIAIISWIFKKVAKLFKRKRKNPPMITFYEVERSRKGNLDDINPAWLMS